MKSLPFGNAPVTFEDNITTDPNAQFASLNNDFSFICTCVFLICGSSPCFCFCCDSFYKITCLIMASGVCTGRVFFIAFGLFYRNTVVLVYITLFISNTRNTPSKIHRSLLCNLIFFIS